MRASAITRSTCAGVTKGRTASCTATISVEGSTCASAFATDCCRVSPPGTTRAGRPSPALSTFSCRAATSSLRVAMKNSVIAEHAASRRSVKIIRGTAVEFEELFRLVSTHAGAETGSRNNRSNSVHERASSLSQSRKRGEVSSEKVSFTNGRFRDSRGAAAARLPRNPRRNGYPTANLRPQPRWGAEPGRRARRSGRKSFSRRWSGART